MRHGLRLLCLFMILGCAVAIGAPEKAPPPTDKPVYPLEKQDGVWWAGIEDACRLVGARVEGTGWVTVGDGQEGTWRELRIPLGAGSGPFRVTVGKDIYQVRVGSREVRRNGERIWDFLTAPKLIEGTPAATLEDLEHLLGLAEGEEVDGQPVVIKDGAKYRLVEGRPPLPVVTSRPLKPFGPGVYSVGPPVGRAGYEEYNGLLYQRGSAGLQYVQPGGTRSSGGTLYGPVFPNRYRAEHGVTADQLDLSIVQVEGPQLQVAEAGRILGGAAAGRMAQAASKVASMRAALRAVKGTLELGKEHLRPEARAELERERDRLEGELATATAELEALRKDLGKGR